MFRFFQISPYIAALLTMLVFVLPCRLRTRAQALWAMVLLFGASKFVCFESFGGHPFAPQLPVAVIWGWNIAYSSLMILTFLSLVLFFLPRRIKLWTLPTLAVALTLLGMYNGLRVPDVHEVTLHYPNLPAALEGYRIVQLADLHVSASVRRWRTEAIVEKANALKGDLMVFTGDLVDGDPRHQLRDVEPIRRLTARDGVWFITGNHERYVDFDAWRPWYERWGIRFLEDAAVRPHEGLYLAGADEPVRIRRVAKSGPRILPLFEAATNGEFRVLLQHRPQWARDNLSLIHI